MLFNLRCCLTNLSKLLFICNTFTVLLKHFTVRTPLSIHRKPFIIGNIIFTNEVSATAIPMRYPSRKIPFLDKDVRAGKELFRNRNFDA